MKRWQFALLLTIGVACVCLSLLTIVFSRQNRKLQGALQAQQVIINKGTLSQQIGTNLLREMATTAQSDEKMRDLLRENGFTVSSQPPGAPPP